MVERYITLVVKDHEEREGAGGLLAVGGTRIQEQLLGTEGTPRVTRSRKFPTEDAGAVLQYSTPVDYALGADFTCCVLRRNFKTGLQTAPTTQSTSARTEMQIHIV